MITFFAAMLAMLATFIGGLALWGCYHIYRVGRSRRSPETGFGYVFVNDDGTVRELSTSEQEYLTMEFSPGDGARPYIKSHFEALDGWKSIQGFIERRQVPANIPIVPVDPNAE